MKYCTTYLLILFTILSFPVFGNSVERDKDPENFNNQLTLDAQFLGIGLGYKRRVFKDFFIGLEIGAGFARKFSIDKPGRHRGLEVFYVTPNLAYVPNSKMQFYIGMTRTGTSNTVNAQVNNGVKVGLFIGGQKLQYGFQLSMGKDESNDFFFYTSLIILKFRLKNW